MEYLAIIPPLLAFLSVLALGNKIGEKGANIITCGGVIIAAMASVSLLFDIVYGSGEARTIPIANWITSGSFKVDWALRLDPLSVVMICTVNIVSACVHIYSIGYMHDDEHKPRFMAYLSLFTFAMLMLVSADNMLQLFFGWEGVGLSSYLLIGFWNHKRSANNAAFKAFIVNRVGDFGLALGIMAIFLVFGTVQFDELFRLAGENPDVRFRLFGIEVHALNTICILLFIGAMGKSAQLGLHTWLPDAMEGPTPVSALIHAATMVTAGVFLIARMSPLYEYAPLALMIVCIIGAITAFVAASIALVQNDIKRVIAYSTMSQLGYMFFAIGVSAYGAAIFHLVTHAFFKSLLFLGAGSVIHAMSGEQDMRKMGGLRKKIPITYALMWVGTLALCGIPFFSGYYSKDILLEAAWADNSWFGGLAFYLGIAAAVMTAFYSGRLIFMVFHATPRTASDDVISRIHESPYIMLFPLFFLAVVSVFGGMILHDGFTGHNQFWSSSILTLKENDTTAMAHHVPAFIRLMPVIAGITGIALAALFYLRKGDHLPATTAKTFRPIYILLQNKWFFDSIYDYIFIKKALITGRSLWKDVDSGFIDRFLPGGASFITKTVSKMMSHFQNGRVYRYAFIMIAGLTGLVTWFFTGMGG